MDLEDEARIAFKKEFTQEYLNFIDKESTAKFSMVELLWAGFAHGYMLSCHDEDNIQQCNHMEDLASSILQYKAAHEEADKCPAMLLSNGVDPEPARIMQRLDTKRYVMYELAKCT